MIGAFFVWFYFQNSASQQKPWPVPDNYKNMKNPVASDAESIAEGKTL